MKVFAALVIAAFCVATCLGQSNSTEESRIKRQANKGTKGRFLSLPVPQKCATSKCLFSQINKSDFKLNLNIFVKFLIFFVEFSMDIGVCMSV